MEPQRLRHMIDSGLYRVPVEEVAQAVIDEIVDPLGIQRGARRSLPQPPHRSRGFSSTRYRLDHRNDPRARGDVMHAHDRGAGIHR